MKKKSNPKSLARESAFSIIFSSHVGNIEITRALESYLKTGEYEILDFDIRKKVHTWNKNREEIDKLITGHLKKGTIEDLSNVSLNILRLGFCELEYFEEIPPRVVLNEAIELAKKFGDPATAKLVNGILDSHLKTK